LLVKLKVVSDISPQKSTGSVSYFNVGDELFVLNTDPMSQTQVWPEISPLSFIDSLDHVESLNHHSTDRFPKIKM
jgi:hypothetical protein